MELVALTFGALDEGGRARAVARARLALRRRGAGREPDVLADREDLVVLGTGVFLPDPPTGPVPLVHGPVVGAPPWAELRLLVDGCEVATDAVAFKHVSVHQGTGWAGASTSSLVLGAVTDEPLDERAWAHMALVGNLIGRVTPVRGVRRLGASEVVRLRGGRAEFRQEEPPSPPRVHTLAEAVSVAVAECLDAAPDATLELSGGLDSRIILAAIPPERRRGRRAVTLGPPDHVDSVIARRIAAQEGLAHEHHEARLAELDSDEVWGLVTSATLARDVSVPALAAAMAQHFQDLLGVEPQFNGAAGGVAKAFFSVGIPADMQVTRRAVRLLVQLRMTANHRVPDSVFADDWVAGAHEAVLEDVRDGLLALGLPLRQASDEFFLRDRVANWAGAAYSHAAAHRPLLSPHLHPAFIEAGRALPHEQRLDARAYAAAIAALEPALGDVPLDSGVTPLDLAGGLSRWARQSRRLRKAANKVRQHATQGRRPPTGVTALLPPVAEALREDDLREDVASLGWFAGSFLDPAVPVPADVDTLSLLVSLATARRFLEGVRTDAESDVLEVAAAWPEHGRRA